MGQRVVFKLLMDNANNVKGKSCFLLEGGLPWGQFFCSCKHIADRCYEL